MNKLFIKDSIEGIANESLTPELAFRLGRAWGALLSGENKASPKILVGKDTRVSGDMLEAALTSGICSVGAQVVEVGVMPLPALAFLIGKYKMDGGIMISASDEPMEYNGIKFLDGNGNIPCENVKKETEDFANGIRDISPYVKTGREIGRISCSHTALRDYVDYVKKATGSDLGGLKIAIDCANGAAYQCAKLVFKELGADVEMINNIPNGVNINDGCGVAHPENLMKFVVSHRCSFGFVLGGDAGKMMVSDECGNLVDVETVKKIVCESDEAKTDGLIAAVILADLFVKSGKTSLSDFVAE